MTDEVFVGNKQKRTTWADVVTDGTGSPAVLGEMEVL